MAINRLLDSLDKFQSIKAPNDFHLSMAAIELRWSAQTLINRIKIWYPDLDKLQEPVQELQELCNTFSSILANNTEVV